MGVQGGRKREIRDSLWQSAVEKTSKEKVAGCYNTQNIKMTYSRSRQARRKVKPDRERGRREG